jgi:hypothetical protein
LAKKAAVVQAWWVLRGSHNSNELPTPGVPAVKKVAAKKVAAKK